MSHGLRNLILLLLFVAVSLCSGVTRAQMTEWCIADEQTSDDELQAALDWACEKGANCTKIQEHGECFFPDTLKDHASYAFNNYYQKMKQEGGSCHFNSAATLTSLDPSHDDCVFEHCP